MSSFLPSNPPLENTLNERSQILLTFQTFNRSDDMTWPKLFQTNSFLPQSATHGSDEVPFHFPIPVNWLFYIGIFCLFTRRSEFKNLWGWSPNSSDSWFALLRLYHIPERARRPYSEWAFDEIWPDQQKDHLEDTRETCKLWVMQKHDLTHQKKIKKNHRQNVQPQSLQPNI